MALASNTHTSTTSHAVLAEHIRAPSLTNSSHLGSSPIKKKNDALTPQEKAKQRHLRMSKQLRGQFAGPMAYKDFTKNFMSPVRRMPSMPPIAKDLFSSITRGMSEKDMYQEFIKIFRETKIPNLFLVDTSGKEDPASDKDNKIRFDLGWYDSSDSSKLKTHKTQYKLVEFFIEVKNDEILDAFVDPVSDEDTTTDWEPETEGRSSGRGQSADYVLEMLRRQHRKFVFSVYVSGLTVRFFRWDFAGAIVSESINYKETPQLFVDFLWRFAFMSKSERGWDETVRLANEDEQKIAREKLSPWATEDSDVKYPFRVFWVPADPAMAKDDETRAAIFPPAKNIRSATNTSGPPPGSCHYRKFLAWTPFALPLSPTGRGTYGYPVYEEKTNGIYFLKGNWRSLALEKEGDILNHLNDNHVRNVPQFLCGDDIPGPGHNTVTHIHAVNLKNGTAGARAHYRFVEDVVARPLRSFTWSRQLLQAIYDAFVAHKDAYTCGVLHRDISIGNIMLIGDDGCHGILNDWDLAIRVDKMNSGPRQRERTGTWQFMSVGLLQNSTKLHVVQDDMESFIYVLLYLALAHIKNDKVEVLDGMMYDIFDSYGQQGDEMTGGAWKSNFLHRGSVVFPDCPPLTNFIRDAIAYAWQYIDWCIACEKKKEIAAGSTSSAIRPRSPMPEDELVLRNHDNLEKLFEDALKSTTWPAHEDAVPDQRRNARIDGLASIKTHSQHAIVAFGQSLAGTLGSQPDGAVASSGLTGMPSPQAILHSGGALEVPPSPQASTPVLPSLPLFPLVPQAPTRANANAQVGARATKTAEEKGKGKGPAQTKAAAKTTAKSAVKPKKKAATAEPGPSNHSMSTRAKSKTQGATGGA